MQLRVMRKNDPTAKALVFSQFVSTIEWLKGKLREHGFGYRTISGSMPQKQRAKVVTVRLFSMLTLHACCKHWALLCCASVSTCLPTMESTCPAVQSCQQLVSPNHALGSMLGT